MSLSQPSRTIVVEPLEVTAPAPAPEPEEPPRRTEAPPAPAEPAVKP